ncbi:hypothetical protein DFH06DRAFT_448770 [Mycena polygramma]|nr:hypothetical protein DFH06DRAFT_448770 [Mycena polygramma]
MAPARVRRHSHSAQLCRRMPQGRTSPSLSMHSPISGGLRCSGSTFHACLSSVAPWVTATGPRPSSPWPRISIPMFPSSSRLFKTSKASWASRLCSCRQPTLALLTLLRSRPRRILAIFEVSITPEPARQFRQLGCALSFLYMCLARFCSFNFLFHFLSFRCLTHPPSSKDRQHLALAPYYHRADRRLQERNRECDRPTQYVRSFYSDTNNAPILICSTHLLLAPAAH